MYVTVICIKKIFLKKVCNLQGTHGTGKTGKMVKKIPCQGKHREFGNFAKTRGNTGNFFYSSCKFPNSNGKGYCNICPEKFHFFPRSWMSLQVSFFVCNSNKLCKLAQGKFAVGQGKHREFHNII